MGHSLAGPLLGHGRAGMALSLRPVLCRVGAADVRLDGRSPGALVRGTPRATVPCFHRPPLPSPLCRPASRLPRQSCTCILWSLERRPGERDRSRQAPAAVCFAV